MYRFDTNKFIIRRYIYDGRFRIKCRRCTSSCKRRRWIFRGNGIIILILFFLIFGFGGNGIKGLERSLCNVGYANLQQINQLSAQLVQIGFQNQQCCCETNRNIDAVHFENARNTYDITTATHNEGKQTRALITANVM